MQPKVCTIIVNYNGARDTIACLDSLSKITYTNHIAIVVDNASRETAQLKDYVEDKGFYFLELKDNRGFAAGNNAGIRYAIEQFEKIDYFLLLNNDTEVDPYFLEPLVEECERDEKVGACGSHINYYTKRNETWFGGGDIKWLTGRVLHKTPAREEGKLSDENFLTGCVLLLPVSILDKVGFLNEEYFLYYEDAAYSIEIRKAGYRLRYVPTSLVYHKISATTGYQSPLSNYYGTRNNLLFMSLYAKKPVFFIFFLYFVMKNIVKYLWYIGKGKQFKRVSLAIKRAFYDFATTAKGKREYPFM